ncbi:MAG: potassium-transporting ATPase subunit KdpA [Bacteroidetes bacterium]|nr:potassium-transporting ATPase subunit KdpA [Bacteroidota bacterium]
MDIKYFIQPAFLLLTVTLLTPPAGRYLFRVFEGKIKIPGFIKAAETLIYRICGIRQDEEMNWKTYLWSVLAFNFAGMMLLFLLQIFQNLLPLNPQGFGSVPWDLAFNTAVSFVTNTNWQAYAGETTMSYAVQMSGLAVQNFLSAATGITVILALSRGITSRKSENLGNFWKDLVRSVLYILIPGSVIVSVLLMGQGVIQNFSQYLNVTTLEGISQTIPMGPAASQVAIKMLGTNGGGFFNSNSAHPFENPTPFSNFIEMFCILIIPAALTYAYGLKAGSKKEGWIIFGVMMFLLVSGFAVSIFSELSYNPALNTASLLEGKELRFGTVNSVLFSTITTDVSCGAVNAMHSSLSPLAGMVALVNIMLGEIIFGGVGSGLYGMLIFIFITVFIAGLMVGRTPEYLGKKIEALEIKMAIIAVLIQSAVILMFTAAASVLTQGTSSALNSGPHGFSEILYTFSSAVGNNGSAFAGLNANTVFYNILTGIAMLVGRFGVIIPVMVIAGNLGKKNISPVSAGTFRTDNYVFALLLTGVILIVGALTFFPALCLGPIAEHILMGQGVLF